MKNTAVMLMILSACVAADVKHASTSTMEFGGTLGKVMRFFGASKPTNTVDYYAADLKRSDSFKDGKLESTQIIDLDKELFITVNHTQKEYSQMTFEEWRQMMRETLESLKQSEKPEKSDRPNDAEVKWNVTFDVKETGEKENVAGHSADKVVLTIRMEAEVTAQEEGGEPETARTNLVVTSTEWLYRGQDKAQKEMQAFHLALFKKLGFAPDALAMQKTLNQVFATYPQMAEAMERLQKESEKLAGFSMRTVSIYESEPDPATTQRMKEEKKKEEAPAIPTSVSGLAGALGKKMVQKQMEKKQAASSESGRTKLMSVTAEVTELSTAALDRSLFDVPAGFKLVKMRE